MKARHGLIVGKFYPPHVGHHSLIDDAAASCDHLSVIVAASDQESLSLDHRVGWLKDVHWHTPHIQIIGCIDNHPIDYDDPRIWDLHMNVFNDALVTSSAPVPVDAVFSNESYGMELARRFHAVHIDTGMMGSTDRLSASAVRADPVGHWEDISPPVRAHLTKRVVVVGAESTGTTTLTQQLRNHFRDRGGAFGLTQSVPEFGRTLTRRKLAEIATDRAIRGEPQPTMTDLVWTDQDFLDVTLVQNIMEDKAALLSGPILFCDTDSWVTALWQRRYVGRATASVEASVNHQLRSLYLVTHHEGVPFVQDGMRDGEYIRADMTQWIIDGLEQQQLPYVVISGNSSISRLQDAIEAVDGLLLSGWNFGIPIEYAIDRKDLSPPTD